MTDDDTEGFDADDAAVVDDPEDGAPAVACDHDPAVGYAVGFVVRDDVATVESACSMRATVHERTPDADDVDAVGCAVDGCTEHHERVAERLRRDAARHSGNVTGNDPGC